MEERHKALLRDKRLEITSDLRFRDIRRRLLDSGILNGENLDEIENQQTREDQAKALLDTLPTKGPNAFSVFREALKDRYPHLARILNDEGQHGPPGEPRVFIIHAGEDKESFVRPLVTKLTQQGLAEKDIFFDDVSIKPGEVIRDRIISTLTSQSLELAVVVVSTSFLNKPYWPKLEYETCLKNNKHIFPIWVDTNEDNFKAFSELVGKYSPTLKQMSGRRVHRDHVIDELTSIAAEVVERLSTLGGITPEPTAMQALMYVRPSGVASNDSASSDEEIGIREKHWPTTGEDEEQIVENKLKEEKTRELEVLYKWGKMQLDLLKDAESLLSREETEKQTRELLLQIRQYGFDIMKVKKGCAIIHMVPNDVTNLDRFWTDYKSGQLSNDLTERLISSEMQAVVGQDLSMRVIILEEQYLEWKHYLEVTDTPQTVRELQGLKFSPTHALGALSVNADNWEDFVECCLPGGTEQVKLLLDSAWRDPVVELVTLIPFFWPHIVTYWLEMNHTFPKTLTELLQYSLRKHFASQTGNVSVSEQESPSLSETITESLITLGPKGLDSIVQSNCREIDLNADERKSLDPAVFGLLKLTETKRYTFVNTFLHDFCVALYTKDTLDRATDTAVFQQLIQNAGRMPLVCFFTSGLLGDRAGDFLSALAKDGVFDSPFQKVETCLIALAETSHVQSLYQCIESVFDGSVLDVSSESVLSLLFSSAAITFINQSHVVQSVRLCDRSKLKEQESKILRELEVEPDVESVRLFSNLLSDVSDRNFILLLLQCIPLLSAVKKAGSKSKGQITCKTPLKIHVNMHTGTLNSIQMFQLTQAIKHLFALTYLNLHCNYVEDDRYLVGHISPSTKYCSTAKLTTSPVMMLMSSLPRLASLQELEFFKCSFLSATEVNAMCDGIKGSWQLIKLYINVLQDKWHDTMGVAIGKVFLKLPNLLDLQIGNDYNESETALVHAVKNLGALKKLQKLKLLAEMSNIETKKTLARSLQHLECLKHLDLAGNKLLDDGCIVITEAFYNMSSIEELQLRYNYISVSGAKSFIAHVGYLTCLKHINLGYNKLSDDGCIVIAEGFHNMRSLVRLDLSSNSISDRGGSVLMGKITILQTTRWLDLHGNMMTDAVAQLVVDVVNRIERLGHVNLSSNRFSSEGVKILQQCRRIDSSGQDTHVEHVQFNLPKDYTMKRTRQVRGKTTSTSLSSLSPSKSLEIKSGYEMSHSSDIDPTEVGSVQEEAELVESIDRE
ncbi:NLRC3 [Branchiostoma lanceolatum]|uniref:NLRC3 protein n=1 Tax=Branchiostoma lanceolatum TaxID=7740 RepID=A0A8J9VJQ4_BRALA|nr:NLRC3 [Branchiostoma lanceolatum]